MHTNDPIVFADITPEHFTALELLAQKHNLSVVGTSGRTQKDGFDVEWGYETETQTLTIKVLQSPFWVPEFMIQRHFADWVDQSKPTASPAAAQTVSEQVTPSDAPVLVPVKTEPEETVGGGTPAPSSDAQKAPISPK